MHRAAGIASRGFALDLHLAQLGPGLPDSARVVFEQRQWHRHRERRQSLARIVRPFAADAQANGHLRVDAGLLQLQLGPGTALTIPQRAQFRLRIDRRHQIRQREAALRQRQLANGLRQARSRQQAA